MDYALRVVGTALVIVAVVVGAMWFFEYRDRGEPVAVATEPKPSVEKPVVEEPVSPSSEPAAAVETPEPDPQDEPEPQSQKPISGKGVITGTVVHALNNQPIGGATITVELSDWNPFDMPPDEICRKTTTSTSDGTFKVTGLPVLPTPLIFGVAADKDNLGGYAPHGVALTRAEPKGEVTIQIARINEITGMVRATDGTPVANAIVTVSKVNDQMLTIPPAIILVGRGTSDTEGRFTLRHGSPLPVGLRVVSTDYPMQDFGPFAIDATNVELVLEPGMAVSGKVLVKGSGMPVAEGALRMTEADTGVPYDTKTDKDGAFLFKSVAPGQFREYLKHERYVLADPEATLTVSPGGDIEDLILYATEGATISGRVFDEDTNAGIAGAKVRIINEFERSDEITDEKGYYSKQGIPGGHLSMTPMEAKGYPPPDWQMRRELTVTPGQSIDTIDFGFRKGLCISGIILDPEGQPVPNTRVTARPSNGGNDRSASSDENGRFEILGILPTTGLYAYAKVDGYGCPPAGPFDLIDEGISDVTLQLTEASIIEGVVVDPNGNPVPNAGVYAKNPNINSGNTTHADAQGQFTLANLYAGKYILYPNRPTRGGFYLDQPHPVEVGEGEHLTGVELTLMNVGGLSISGRITSLDGAPINWANVEVRGSNGSYMQGTQSEQNGHYSIEGLTEGDYTLTVSSGSCYKGEPVTVPAGSENIDIVLPPAGCVKGQVVDARTSQPVQQFELYGTQGHRQFETWMQNNFSPKADAEGRFSYSSISQPQFTLFFRASGYATMAVPISDVGPGETLDGVLVKLEPSNPIEGIVQTDRGEPVSGARIFVGDVPDSYNRNYGEASISRADGSFTIDSLPADTVTISACHPAYAPGSGIISTNGSITIVLTEGGVIQGRVTKGGKPFEGAQIQASFRKDDGSSSYQGTEHSDANGEYIIAGLQPSENYRVSAYLRDERRNRSQENVVVEAGMTTEVNFDFPLADASIEGRVTIDGQPPSGRQGYVSANMVVDGEPEDVSAQIGLDGSYRIEAIPAGVVSVQAYAYDQNGQSCRRLLKTETYSGRTTLLDIELNGGTKVTGQVTNLPAGWIGSVIAFSGEISIPDNLSPLDFESAFGQNPPISSTQISGDGSFTLGGLEPGTVTLLVYAMDSAIDQLARNGVPDEETIRKMTRTASVVINVSADGDTTVDVAL